MAKTKRISINTLEKIAKSYANESIVEWSGIEVVVKRHLSLKEMLGFVDSVVKSCFDVTTADYIPEIKDFAIRSNILDTYANFTMPSNPDTQYDLIYRTDAVQMVLENIDMDQFKEIMRAIDAKIDYKVNTNIQLFEREITQLATSFSELIDRLNGFTDIEAADIQKLVGAITNGDISEEKIVKAYMAEKSAQESTEEDGTKIVQLYQDTDGND